MSVGAHWCLRVATCVCGYLLVCLLVSEGTYRSLRVTTGAFGWLLLSEGAYGCLCISTGV